MTEVESPTHPSAVDLCGRVEDNGISVVAGGTVVGNPPFVNFSSGIISVPSAHVTVMKSGAGPLPVLIWFISQCHCVNSPPVPSSIHVATVPRLS
jgi:hypothetical protein